MNMMKKQSRLFCAMLLLCSLLLAVCADASADTKEAKDLAEKCILRFSVNSMQKTDMLARSLHKYWDAGKDGVLRVTLPEKQKSQGVMLSFYQTVPEVIIESLDGKKPVEIARYTLPYQNDYIPFTKPAHSFQIRAAKGGHLQINRLNVLSEGKLPDWVQRWEPPLKEADIQLIACHPDDEVLWFGGLLPTYAGQLKKRVQVTFIHTGTRYDRRNELLDALWYCGVHVYPNVPKSNWTKKVNDYVIDAIRRTKASVVVTQDVNGEYGNENHKTMTQAVIKAVTGQCADAKVRPSSAKKYGVWQPQKLYIHLWPENQSVFDWSKKLSKMGNQSGFTIAQKAFEKHMSQQNGRYEVAMSGRYDCRLLGLYFTLVGPDDTKHPDLLQNIPAVNK